jgi:hypothetical protein
MPDSQPLKLFIIYAREDQSALLELKAHLRPLEKRGDLTVWYDGEILPGQDWDKAIKEQLATADIVLLFISKHFFNSEYIEKEELKKALERHKKGEAVVVPVIVKPCLWDAHGEIVALQVLPKDGRPVSSWRDADEAFTDVAKGVQNLMLERKNAMESKIVAEKVEEAAKAFTKYQYEKAFSLLTWLITSKYSLNPRGCNLLGLLYNEGKCVTQNYSEAVKWYQKAAEQGNVNGQINLAFMYEKGLGVERNISTAVSWYTQAAKQGDEDAKYALKRLGYSE